jgi:hypothetical protein
MKWLNSMLADGHNGSVSSKRVVTFIAFIVVCVSYIADQFFGYAAKPTLFESMMYIVIAGLGFTVSEKFAKKDE